MGSLRLLLLAHVCSQYKASPFEPHRLPDNGPWFEGWFTRLTDVEKNRSIALICGSLQKKGSKMFDSSWVALLATTPEGQMYTEQVFPDQESIIITDNGQPVTRDPKMNIPASFEWKSSMGFLRFNGNVSCINFTFPSGVVFRMESETRVPWDESCPDSCGPEGWIGIVPKALPTHYFIQSLASHARYVFNGSTGDGFAHQETNFGSRFPVAWVWI